MNFRSTAILFAVMFSMLWLFGLMLAFKKNPLDRAYVVPTLQAARDVDIVSVTIQRKPKDKDAQEFQFTQENDVWRLKDTTSGVAVKVEGFRINDIVNQVKGARKDEEFGVSSDLARFGLNAPQATITIKGRTRAKPADLDHLDGKDKKDEKKDTAPAKEMEWTFYLGNESADNKNVFCNSSDEKARVFAVTKSSIDSLFFEDPNHLRSKRLFDFTDATAKTLEIKQANDALELKKGDDNLWRFEKPALGFADFEGLPAPKDLPPGIKLPEAGVKGLIAAIQNIRVDADGDFVAAAKDNLPKYKLEDGKEMIRIQVGTADFKKETTKETLLIGDLVRDYYYARLGNDEGVFKLKAKLVEPVLEALNHPGKLRSLDVGQFDPKAVDAFTLRIGKDETKLWHPEGKPWQIQLPPSLLGGEGSGVRGAAKKANELAVTKLLDTLQGKRQIQDYHDDADTKAHDAKWGLDSPVLEVNLYTGGLEKKAEKEEKKDAKKDDKKDEKKGEKKEEKKETKQDDGFELKKDAQPALTLRFGKADKETVAVLRGTDARFVVPKAMLDAAAPAEGPLAFLDSALPAFDVTDIIRLELQRGAKKLELERATGSQAGRWLVKEGKDKADQNLADVQRSTMVFNLMGGLTAKKWHKRLDAKDDLDAYGLKTPTLSVTVKKLRVTPAAAATALALLSLPAEARPLAAASAFAALYGDQGETIVIQFGKETTDKDTYAKHSGSDLLFAVPSDLVKMLRELDLRDKTALLLIEPYLGAGAVGAPVGQPLAGLTALAPVNTGIVTQIDPAKIKEIRLAMRNSFELRELAFQRKDKTWIDQSSLKDFTVDAERVEQLAKDFANLRADRIISLAGGPKADQKLAAKDFIAKIDLVTDDGKTISITVGAALDRFGYFAHATNWPNAVFLLPATRIEPLARGVSYFAKERVAVE